eukprot:668128-Prymnesium_polylepis.1
MFVGVGRCSIPCVRWFIHDHAMCNRTRTRQSKGGEGCGARCPRRAATLSRRSTLAVTPGRQAVASSSAPWPLLATGRGR